MSVCLSVCLSAPLQNTHFRVSWRLLFEERTPNIGLWCLNLILFFIIKCFRLLKHAVLDKPFVNNGGVNRGRSVTVAVAVGCWLFALEWHFDGTSTALQRHFHGTSSALQRQFKKKNNGIVACIPISREIQCLPYAGSLSTGWFWGTLQFFCHYF